MSSKKPDAFKIERNDTGVFACLLSPDLIKIVREYLPRESVYESNPKVPAHELFSILPVLQNAIGRDPVTKKDITNGYNTPRKIELTPLVDWIEKEYESLIYKIKGMTDNNVITYNNLFYLFPRGQHIRATWNQRTVGAKVVQVSYINDRFGQRQLNVKAEVIDSDGVTLYRGLKTFVVDEWEGACEIDDLPVAPLSDSIREELIKNGRKFVKYAIGPHHLYYKGNLFRKYWCGIIYFKSVGRLMVDTVSFFKMNPGTCMDSIKKSIRKTVKDDELFMCSPSLYGFSFASKRWGQLYVDELEEITFDDTAFDQLVMDPIKKELILSLVSSDHKGMDIISGKGGGCIFLLHGPPGVGKTLTAEAISEYLHRPLHSVSVGELGTRAVDLEKKLNEILEVANIWNAVILIDEADIFLERRSENDTRRNALVSVFLRLLEYHQGILFLTTNRVKCFDAAFQSRISIALKYNELDTDAREKIWRTFLDRVEGKDKSQVNIENLKERPLNGREIKTAVRLAKALTVRNNPNALITTQQLETILDISKSFREEILNQEEIVVVE